MEALTLSTRIAIFFEGELVQVDTPINIYTNPKDLRVADFIGNPRTNFVDAKAQVQGGSLKVVSPLESSPLKKKDFTDEPMPEGDFDCVMGIRPEQITIRKTNFGGMMKGQIYACQPAGSETLVPNAGRRYSTCSPSRPAFKHYKRDQQVGLEIDSLKITVYNKQSGKLLKFAEIEEED